MKQQRQLKNLYLVSMVLCAMLLGLSSCNDEKDLYDPTYETPNPLESLSAPENFDWKTTATMAVKVDVAETNAASPYQIEVFTSNPVSNTSAKALTAGYARKGLSFVSTVTVSKEVNYIFIRQTTPDGFSSVRSYAVEDGKGVVCDFGAATPAPVSRGLATRSGSDNITPPVIDPDDRTLFPVKVPEDAVQVPNSWIVGTATNWKNLIINKNVSSLNDVGQYVNLFVTEDVTLPTINKRHYKHIYILPGVKLTITGALEVDLIDWKISIGEGAELVVNGKLTNGANNSIYNLGEITASTVHAIGTSLFYNFGKINVTNNTEEAFYSDTYSKLYNLGSIDVNGSWTVTGSEGDPLVLYNNNEVVVAGSILLNSRTINFFNDVEGTVVCTGFNSTGSSKTINYGSINVNGHTQVESKDIWTNKGKWITETMGTKSYDAQYLNECYLEVTEKLKFAQARFINAKGSYILTKDLHMENTRIDMYDESYIHATGVTFVVGNRPDHNEGVYGIGTDKRALFRMAELTSYTNGTNGQQQSYFSGNLQVACSNYPGQYDNGQYNGPIWEIANGAEWADYNSTTISIPTSECNDGWNPTPGPIEPIGPVTDSNTYTYAFEDNWPFYGDYDMNDVVIRINEITVYPNNEDNKTEKLEFTVSVRAVGAEKRIAGALMLDQFDASQVKSVTYSHSTPTIFGVTSGGVESNQSKAVIPLFDTVHGFMGKPSAWFINTNNTSPDNVANPPVMTVTVEFSDPVDINGLNVKDLNLFIVADINKISITSNRRKEIHLRGYSPTELADETLFGNNNDNSLESGIYYKSKDNLPWGIMFATQDDPFRWPMEYIKIQDAYLGFTGWVNSGGGDDNDWWKSPVSGKVYEE